MTTLPHPATLNEVAAINEALRSEAIGPVG